MTEYAADVVPPSRYRIIGITEQGNEVDLGVYSQAEYVGAIDTYQDLYPDVKVIPLQP